MSVELIHNPDRTLYSVLAQLLDDPALTRMRAAVSYVQLSGAALLFDNLTRFRGRGGRASVVCAADQPITTYEGLLAMLEAGVDVSVYRSSLHGFHPKVWLWYSGLTPAASVVGSGNMTKGGLVRNVEIGNYLRGPSPEISAFHASLEATIDRLEMAGRVIATRADLDVALVDFAIPHERTGRQALDGRGAGRRGRPSTPGVPPAPTPQLPASAKALVNRLVREATRAATVPPPPGVAVPVPAPPVGPAEVAGVDVDFLLVEANPLRRPRTPGELRLPVPALRLAPLFWDWPDSFIARTRAGSVYWDRRATCRFRSSGMVDSVEHNVRIYYYPRRVEFRITSAEFRARGDVGDIIAIELSDVPDEDFVFTITRVGQPEHGPLLVLCNEVMQGGRRWALQ